MKYRVTWFNKETRKVHSEGKYEIAATIKEIADHYNSDLNEWDDFCVMADPDHFPHSKAGNESE